MGIVAKFRDRCRASGGGKRKGATSRRGLAASPPPESQAVVGHGSDGVEPAATSPTPASPCSSDDPGGEGDKKRKNHPMGKSRGRASSSGLAASLLPEAQGAVPVVGFGASRVEPAALLASSSADPDGSVRLPPDMDGEMLQHLRTLGWKNPTTKAAFPQLDSSRDTLILCMKEPLLYLNEYLKLTTQALSDKVTPMDERVISSSLLAMATLIDGGDSTNTESKSHSKVRSATLSSSAEAALSMHKYFIDFLRSKSAVIRSATYALLTSYVKYVPNVFNEEAMKILSPTLLGAFNEKDPLCHSAMWDAVLVFSRRFPEAWSYCNVQEVVLYWFWQFLQNGCYGSKQASYPLIVQFLDSIPPKEVVAEQFAFEFLKHLWAGRNQRQLSAADSLAFFTAFKQSFLWLLKNAPRNSVGDSSDYICNRLITNVLVKMVWQDYLQLSLSKNLDVVPSSLSEEASTSDHQLSHKKSLLAANVRHPIYYYQDLGKCIVEILDDISVTESHLLETACESLLRDYLDIVQQGEKLSKFQDHVDQLVSFFRSLDILVQNGRTWPLENLARPLVEHSLPAIKSMDSPSLVKLLLVLVEIFGPAPLFLKSSEINDDKSYVESYLSLFNADFVPWCLDGKYSTCSSKIDLLLSLIQEECFFDQWCLIIKHTRAKQKQSVDHKISHTKDQFELLALILQKARERIAGGKLKILQRSASLPEHWRPDLLDSVAVSVFCDLPATDLLIHKEAAFPQSDSSRDAFMLCVNETFLYLNENLKSTTQALSDKVTPMDVLDERVKKLDKLQKESDDEPSERTRQLEDVINTLQEKLIQVENDYQKKLETVSLANCDLKKEIVKLEQKMSEMSSSVGEAVRRKRQDFTAEEIDVLREGVARFAPNPAGKRSWVQIREYGVAKGVFLTREPGDLMRKWNNMKEGRSII